MLIWSFVSSSRSVSVSQSNFLMTFCVQCWESPNHHPLKIPFLIVYPYYIYGILPVISYSGISTTGGLVLDWYPWQQSACIYWKPHSSCSVAPLSAGPSEVVIHNAYINDIPALQAVFSMFLMKSLFIIPAVDFCYSCRREIKYDIGVNVYLHCLLKFFDSFFYLLSFFFWFVLKGAHK